MKKLKGVLFSLIGAGIVFPLVFTLFELGVFLPEPSVEIRSEVTSPTASVLKVASSYEFSPYSFLTFQGEQSGLDIEVVNEVANRLGMRAQIVFSDWAGCKKLIQSGEVDAISGLEIFSDMENVDMTIPISSDSLGIFGTEKIRSVGELSGKRVSIVKNSIVTRIFSLNCEWIEYPTNRAVLEAVESGEADFAVCHFSVAKRMIEESRFGMRPLMPLMQSYPAIGVRSDRPELYASINSALRSMSRDGVIASLNKKWVRQFAEKNTLYDVLKMDAKFYLVYFVLFVAGTAALLLVFQRSRQREDSLRVTLEYQNQIMRQFDLLNSIAGIYMTMHVIDLKNDTIVELKSTRRVSQLINGNCDANARLRKAIGETVVDECVDEVVKFTDLSTVSKRLGEKQTILSEFRGKFVGWFVAQFIAIERDSSGAVTEVAFTTQCIDDMKREMDRLIKMSNVDSLTRLLNRRAFESKMDELVKSGNEFSLFVLDVNELKRINDDFGHIAGDEIICAAASKIREAFLQIGNCYRTGGDEFSVLVGGKTENAQSLVSAFKKSVSEWRGNFVDSLSVSVGFASSTEIPEFSLGKVPLLVEMADKRMYEDKEKFYSRQGIDRRAQTDAFKAICEVYEKIIRVNIETGEFKILKITERENSRINRKLRDIYDWFSYMVDWGAIFKDDIELFKRWTSREFLLEYFSSNEICLVQYRRMFDDDFSKCSLEMIRAGEYSESNRIVYLCMKNIGLIQK